LDIRRLKDGGTSYEDGTSIVQVHDVGEGVSLHVRRGVITIPFARYVIEDGERQLATAGRFVLMVDGTLVKMHTTEFRDALTRWFLAHEAAEVHVLAQSKMVEMAVTVASMAMNDHRARAYSDVAEWEAVGRSKVGSFARRPLDQELGER
jgi:hypothetical protein